MTPRERAVEGFPCDDDKPFLRWAAIEIAARLIDAALAEERARVAAERAVPGAPLTEEQLNQMRNYYVRDTPILDHVAFLEALLRDAAAHGELEQYRRGELAGWNAALEKAAKEVPSPKLAEIIRALKMPIT
jgi:hypothetical protein